ncbi:MAG: hypothetical protein ACOX2O_08815 [Bdellovibrionota bacterium]
MSEACICTSYTDKLFTFVTAVPTHILLFSLAALVIFILVYYTNNKGFNPLHRAASKTSLRSSVIKEKKKYYNRNLSARYEDFLILISTPSRKLFYLYLAVFILLFFISHSCIYMPSWLIWCADENALQNFFAALTGIGALIFALIIFISELDRKNIGKLLTRVFLIRTKLLFLLSLCLFSFLIFLGPTINIVAIILLLPLCILTVLAVFRVIQLTLSQTQTQSLIDKLLRRDLVIHVENSISRRISKNIIRDFLTEETDNIEFCPWIFRREEYDHVIHPNSGTVIDIDLKQLRKVLNKIASKTITPASIKPEGEDLPPDRYERKEKEVLAYLRKCLDDKIEDSDKTILSIKKGHLTLHELQEVQQLIKTAYKIKRKTTNEIEELRNVLKEIKDNFIFALANNYGGQVDRLVETYTNLAEEFLKVLSRYPAQYDLKAARNEISNKFWGESWEEINWLVDDIRDITEYCLRNAESILTNDLHSSLHLPISICSRAIKYSDNFLFQSFLPSLTSQFNYGHRITNNEIRNLVLDNCVRYPKELGSYYITPQLTKKHLSQQERERIGDMILYLSSFYAELIREAYLNEDTILVNKFIDGLNSCADDFRPSSDRWNMKYLKERLKVAATEDERKMLSEQIKEQKFLEELESKICSRKREVSFYVATKLLDGVYSNNGVDWSKSFKKALDLLPSDFFQLFVIFSDKANGLDPESINSIGPWQRSISEKEISRTGIDKNLSEVFCIKLLSSPSMINDSIDPTTINAEMSLLCEPNGELRKTLISIKSKKTQLKNILSDEQWSSINKVQQFFDKIVEINKKNEELKKQISSLSDKKLNNFKENTIKFFKQHLLLRPILDSVFNCYVDRTTEYETKDVVTIGLNQISDKAIFIEPWDVSYRRLEQGYGQAYGESIALGENLYLFRKLKEFVVADQRSNLLNHIKNNKNSILILINVSEYILFEELGLNFTSNYKLPTRRTEHRFAGILDINGSGIDVFSLYMRSKESGVFIINKALKIKIEQFAPFAPLSPSFEQRNEIGFEILDLNINDDRRNELIQIAPDWLIKVSNDEKEQENYLRRRAQVTVIERMRITKAEPDEKDFTPGFWIPLEDLE